MWRVAVDAAWGWRRRVMTSSQAVGPRRPLASCWVTICDALAVPRKADEPVSKGMVTIRTDGFVEPCIPTLAAKAPSGSDWVHEIKHDGYRLIVRRDAATVRLFTRRGHDWTDCYPAIASAAAKLGAKSFTIDGEAVIAGVDGIAVFDALHRRHKAKDAMLYAFDLLEFNNAESPAAASGRAQDETREAAGARIRRHGFQRAHRGGRGDGVPARLHDGPGGDRVETADGALPVGTVGGLDQGQEPGEPGDAAASRNW
jgi:hypothetical protein